MRDIDRWGMLAYFWARRLVGLEASNGEDVCII